MVSEETSQTMTNRLPVTALGGKPKSMSKDIDHSQLCQWLNSVAQNRDKQAFAGLFKFFAPKILRIASSFI